MPYDHPHEARLEQLSVDPTHTEGIRQRFLREMRGRFKSLRGDVRRVAGYDEDRFHLKQDSQLADPGDIERHTTPGGKERAFLNWLRQRFREVVLEPGAKGRQHWTATYIRAAYGQGWETATNRLQQEGIDAEERDLDDVFNLPVPRRQLSRLFDRTYGYIEDMEDAVIEEVQPVLATGLAEGWNPRKIADELTNEVRDIQHARAETIAHTEIINSFSEATLDRFDRGGVDGVTVSGEFATADDELVCPVCESIAGAEYTTDAMRSATFEFSPSESEADHLEGVYPVKPPVHPRCRCAILPVVE